MDHTEMDVRPGDAALPPGKPVSNPSGRRRRPRRKHIVLAVAALLTLVLVAGVGWFQPYKLWINTTVDDAPPATDAVVIAEGTFVSHEHTTSGHAVLFRLADGSQVLRLDRLDTSNGPLLKVWLSDAPVRADKAGWYVFGDGRQVDLGRLKGNKGSQNYLVPPGVSAADVNSVTVWCDRFDVSFGAAALKATG